MTMKATHEKNELLSRYLEGELDGTGKQEVEQLLEDAAYRDELDFLKRTLSCLGQMPDVEAPTDFSQKVRHRVRRVRTKRRLEERNQPSFAASYGILVGIALTLLVVLFLMFQITEDGIKPSSSGTQAPASRSERSVTPPPSPTSNSPQKLPKKP